jgi:acyl-CoA thioesterase FadM
VILARCELEGIGTSSVRTLESVATRDGAVAAEARSVLVARDAETGRSRPLDDVEREAFQAGAVT